VAGMGQAGSGGEPLHQKTEDVVANISLSSSGERCPSCTATAHPSNPSMCGVGGCACGTRVCECMRACVRAIRLPCTSD
jgi:hypothetical protein